MNTRKRVPPSRLRYEEAHPVISMRVPKVLYLQLKDIKAMSGKSVADVLREAMGEQFNTGTEAWQRGFAAGYKKAEGKFRVNFRCRWCGGSVAIFGPKAMRATAELLREARWGHAQCVPR